MKTSNLVFGSLLAVTIFTAPIGCKDKEKKSEISCEAVYEHARELTPKGRLRELTESMKQGSIAKCERLSDEDRRCLLEAKTFADIGGCNQQPSRRP